MQEYKREKNRLEERLRDENRRAEYHDEHLRIIDAWFSQVGPSLTYNSSAPGLIRLHLVTGRSQDSVWRS